MGPRERHARTRAKTHTIPIILGSFFGFMLICGIAFAVGMVGNVSRWLSDLPDYTDANAYLASEPTTILDANNNQIAMLYVQNRDSVTKDQISKYVLKGTVDVEDERFYEHNGVDFIGIGRAVLSQLSGRSEGASTITQQLVRNTILSEEQFDNTIERKVREAWIALQMEKIFSKDEILTMYLNTIYYGHGAYGIEAASEMYFSKHASELSLAEAALLVGLPNSPSYLDPTVNPEGALARRDKVLDNMLRLGTITQEEADAAKAEQLKLNVSGISESGTIAYPYFVDYVRSLLQEQFSTDVLFKGGLTIKTTIDPTIQKAAEDAAVQQLVDAGADELDVGMVVIEPQTGYIRAMVGGRDYYANDSHINHATSRRAVGSTFKGLTLAAAIHDGMNPNIMLNCTSPMKIADGYTVQNYGGTNYGTKTLAQATAVSSNTGYAQVALAIGNDKIISMCKDLGIDTEAAGMDPSVLSLTLGAMAQGITPLEMAEAYATFASGGQHRNAVAVTEITSRSGATLYKHEDKYDQVLTTGEAQAVTNVLKTVMQGGGTGSSGALSVNQPVAGKTGTAGDAGTTSDIWFCGYTPQYSVAIWAGRSNSNAAITRWHNTQITLPIFRKFMNTVLAGVAREEFPTGETPSYKDNSSWTFVGGSAKKDDEEDEEEEEEQSPEETEGDTPSGDGIGGGETPEPTPTPTPEPTPTPTPTPTPEPTPTPTPTPDPAPTPDPGTGGTTS